DEVPVPHLVRIGRRSLLRRDQKDVCPQGFGILPACEALEPEDRSGRDDSYTIEYHCPADRFSALVAEVQLPAFAEDVARPIRLDRYHHLASHPVGPPDPCDDEVAHRGWRRNGACTLLLRLRGLVGGRGLLGGRRLVGRGLLGSLVVTAH